MSIQVAELGALEEKSLWYKYKAATWPLDAMGKKRPEASPQGIVVHNIMRTLRAFRNLKEVAYVSVPITSGLYYYQMQIERPITMSKGEMIKLAIEHNYHEGRELVEDLKTRRNCPIVYPADLVPAEQRWEQAHFQALWLSIIGELCSEVHMSRGWEFSNGGTEEFAHVFQLRLGIPRHHDLAFWNTKEGEKTHRARTKRIMVYDHEGAPITLDQGVKMIEGALSWLHKYNLNSETLENSLHLLRWTDEMLKQGFYQ